MIPSQKLLAPVIYGIPFCTESEYLATDKSRPDSK